jgi:hypothetical protein
LRLRRRPEKDPTLVGVTLPVVVSVAVVLVVMAVAVVAVICSPILRVFPDGCGPQDAP